MILMAALFKASLSPNSRIGGYAGCIARVATSQIHAGEIDMSGRNLPDAMCACLPMTPHFAGDI